MNNIEIKRIAVPTMDIYAPDAHKYQGLNELEVTSLLLQIAERELSGYWFYNDKGLKEEISDLGEMMWPSRFDTDFELMHDLINLQQIKRRERGYY